MATRTPPTPLVTCVQRKYVRQLHVAEFDNSAFAPELTQPGQWPATVKNTEHIGIRHVMRQLISLVVFGATTSLLGLGHVNAQASSERYVGTVSTSYEYDPVTGLVLSETTHPDTSACVKATFEYDRFGNRKSSSLANCGSGGRSAFAARGSSVDYKAHTVSVGGVSAVVVPEGSMPAVTTNALGQQENRSFDPRFGIATTIVSTNGLTSTQELDEFGRVVRMRQPSGVSTASYYCNLLMYKTLNTPGCPAPAAAELPAAAIRFVHIESRNTGDVKNGGFTRVYYDGLGRLIRSVSEAFDGLGQPSGTARLIVQDTTYNWRGQPVVSTQPYFLDTQSSLAGSTVQYGMTNVKYDLLGRPTFAYITNPKGSQSHTFGERGTFQASKTSYVYDGLSTTITNEKGFSTKQESNVEGRAVRTTDALGAQLAHQYDAFGSLVKTKDALQNIVTIDYDAYGRKLQLNDPDSGIQKYDYNALGELVWQESANQREKQLATTFYYDLLGRLTQRVEPEFTSTWTYDKYADGSVCNKGVGQLCETRSSNGISDTIAYDGIGRPTRNVRTVANGPTFTSSASYDPVHARISYVIYPTGLRINHSYTGKGFLEQQSNGAKVLWQASSVNAWGKLEQYAAGNGVQTNVAYDAKTGDTSEITAGVAGNVLKHSYTYDGLSNLDTRKDHNGPGNGQPVLEEFFYDPINRLKSYGVESVGMTVPTDVKRTVTMEYNALGSMLSKSDVGAYMYPAAGAARPHAVLSITGARPNSYLYDGNGNLTVAGAGKYRSLTYTSFDLPDSDGGILGNNNTRYTWQYDASHARIKEVRRNGEGTRTTWILHPDNVGGLAFEQEFGANGAVTNRHYVAGGVLTTAGAIGNPANPQAGDASAHVIKEEYWHKDYLGSISAVTDGSGNVIQRMAYDPFGKRRGANGNYDVNGNIIIDNGQGTDRGFTGHEHMDDVGVIHMNGRIYDPAVGRFMQADPMIQSPDLLQNFDRYSYVLNNPLNLTDPSGLSWWSDTWKEFSTWLFRQWNSQPRNQGASGGSGSAGSGSGGYSGCSGGGGQVSVVFLCHLAGNGAGNSAGGGLTIGGITVGLGNMSYTSSSKTPSTGSGATGTSNAPAKPQELPKASAATGNFFQDLSLSGTATQFGRKLMADFADNNRGSFGGWGWLAEKADANFERPDETSADGVVAKVGATALLLGLNPRGGAAKTAKDTTKYLYRGVHAGHPAIDAAHAGTVIPGRVNGTVSAAAHNADALNVAKSPFTSWTSNLSVAETNAMKAGQGGVILRIPYLPNQQKGLWQASPDIFQESEILMRGIRHGLEVMK